MHATENMKPSAVLVCPFCDREMPREELPDHLVYADYHCVGVLAAVGYECPCCQKGYDLDLLASDCCETCEEPCSPEVRSGRSQHPVRRARHFLDREGLGGNFVDIHKGWRILALRDQLDLICEAVPRWVDDIRAPTVVAEVEAALPVLRAIVAALATMRRRRGEQPQIRNDG